MLKTICDPMHTTSHAHLQYHAGGGQYHPCKTLNHGPPPLCHWIPLTPIQMGHIIGLRQKKIGTFKPFKLLGPRWRGSLCDLIGPKFCKGGAYLDLATHSVIPCAIRANPWELRLNHGLKQRSWSTPKINTSLCRGAVRCLLWLVKFFLVAKEFQKISKKFKIL